MEALKNNTIKLLLIVNLILGVISSVGIVYVSIQTMNSPKFGERMMDGNMTPPQMNNSQNEDSNSSINQ